MDGDASGAKRPQMWLPGISLQDIPGSHLPFQFERTSSNADLAALRQRLVNGHWRLPPPQCFFTLIGEVDSSSTAGHDQKFSESLTNAFNRLGVEKDVWVFTDGVDDGLSKLATTATKPCNHLVSLGIINKKEVNLANESSDFEENSKRARPNSDIKYFLLLDDEVRTTLTQTFSVRLQSFMAQTNDVSVSVPAVTLLYGGWTDVLEAVKTAVFTNIPIVVIKGSGGFADVLVSCYAKSKAEKKGWLQENNQEHMTGTMIDDVLRKKLRNKIREVSKMQQAMRENTQGPGVQGDLAGPENEEENPTEEEALHVALHCLQKRHLLNICSFDALSINSSPLEQCENLFKTIIQALLKKQENEELFRMMGQFFTTRLFDARQIARSPETLKPQTLIPSSKTGFKEKRKTMAIIFTEAVLMDRPDCVEFILDNEGIDTGEVFTEERMDKLYERSPPSTLKTLENKKIYFKKFGAKKRSLDISRLVPSFCRINTKTNNNKAWITGLSGLFIWAVLMDYMSVAQVFWKKGKDLTVSALIASTMLMTMASSTRDLEKAGRLRKHARKFQNLAIGTLNACYNSEDERTMKWMEKQEHENQWNVNLLKLGSVSVNRRVFSSQAYREYFRNIWMGKINPNISLFRICISSFLFPLVFFIKYRSNQQDSGVTQDEQSKGNLRGIRNSGFEDSPDDNTNVSVTDIKAGVQKDDSSSNQEEEAKRKSSQSVWSTTEEQETNHSQQQTNDRNISPMKKLSAFYGSPVVKFIFNLVFFAGFLGVYAHILMFAMEEKLSVLEYILAAWVFSFLIEEIYQFSTERTILNKEDKFLDYVKGYFHDMWNILDVVSITGFIVGFTLRLIPLPDFMTAGRVVMSVDCMCFMMRLIQICAVTKRLGPLLVMVWRMLVDLVPFLVIMFVFIAAYTVASEAILYPNAVWSLRGIVLAPRKAFWQIFGEFFLEEIEGKEECTTDRRLWSNNTLPRCPTQIGQDIVPPMMAGYILITNVLLLNILIAMFNYTFHTVQQGLDEVWAWQKCQITLEYRHKPPVPPPFTLLWRLGVLLGQLGKLCTCKKSDADSPDGNTETEMSDDETNEEFERSCGASYLNRAIYQREKDKQDTLYSDMQEDEDSAFKW